MLRELRTLVVTMAVLFVGISTSHSQSEKLPTVDELAGNIQQHDAQIHRGRGTIKFIRHYPDKSHDDVTNQTTTFLYAFDGIKVRFSHPEPEGASIQKVDYIADAEKTIRVDSQSSFVWIYDRHQEVFDLNSMSPFRWGPAVYHKENWILVGDYLHLYGQKVLGREAVDEDWCYVVETLQGNSHEKFWIDFNHGYRLRRYEVKTQQNFMVREVQYISVAPDVWFPQSAREKHYDVKPQTGEWTLKFDAEVNLSFEINAPLPEALFTLADFNLPPDTRIIDSRGGGDKSYTVADFESGQIEERAEKLPSVEELEDNGMKGEIAPSFSVQTIEGEALTLEYIDGQPVLKSDKQANGKVEFKVLFLDFWATFSAPCRKEVEYLQRFHEKYSKQGLVIIGIALDENEADVRKFVKARQLTYDIAINSGTAKAYKVEEIPRNYIIDSNGLIHHSHVGLMEGVWRIESAIETLLHQTP